jgi:hypothetical protein
MMFRIVCVTCFLSFFVSAFSHSLSKEDKNIVIDECTQTFTYKIKDKKVIVEEVNETSYVCSQFKSSATISEFHSKNITLDNIKIKSDGEYSKPQHRLYFTDKVLNTDDKICYFDLYFAKKNETASVKIEKTYWDLHYFDLVYFTESFYTKKKTIQLIIPRWMKTEIISKNLGENITQTVTYNSSKDADIYTYQMLEAEAWTKEEHAPGNSYTYPYLLIINHSADSKDFHADFFNSMQDLYDWSRQLVLSVENEENTIRTFAQEITVNASSEEEKIKIVYEWVQENIRYMADHAGIAGYKPEPPQDVLRNKYGDCKGMANLLKHLLCSLGFDARLAWIGTNHLAYSLSVPTVSSINHVICALFFQNEVYYLDATAKYMAFKEYPETIQGQQTLIENGEHYLLSAVPVKDPEQNTETEKAVFSIENQSLVGNVLLTFKGESKNYFLYSVHATLKEKLNDELMAYLSKQNTKYELSQLKMERMQAQEEEISLSYNVINKTGITGYEDKYFINPDFRQDFSDLAIDTAKRKLDYWLPYKSNVIQECEINLPAGMKIESIPKDFLIEQENYTFQIQYIQSENKLIYHKKLTVRNPKITKALFPQWNSDIEQLKNQYREQIVLQKNTL